MYRRKVFPVSVLTDRITVNPEQCGGRPCVRGLRIRCDRRSRSVGQKVCRRPRSLPNFLTSKWTIAACLRWQIVASIIRSSLREGLARQPSAAGPRGMDEPNLSGRVRVRARAEPATRHGH